MPLKNLRYKESTFLLLFSKSILVNSFNLSKPNTKLNTEIL